MRASSLFSLSILSIASIQALAALTTHMPESWLQLKVTVPSQAYEPLSILIQPDRTQCQKMYGNEAYRYCQRSIGSSNAQPKGITMQPAIAGSWRWEGANNLTFTPENPWPEKTDFTVDLASLPLPEATTLQAKEFHFQTPPLTLLSGQMTFWMDPALSGQRALSIDASFSTAILDHQTFEKRVQFITQADSGIQLGSPTFLWNHDHTHLYTQLPIQKLGKTGDVTVVFPSAVVDWKLKKHTGIPEVQKGWDTATLSYKVPAQDQLYRIQEASIRSTRTASLDPIYEIHIRPSLLTKPKELLESLQVVALPSRLNPNAVSLTDWRQAPAITPDVIQRGKALSVHALEPADTPTDHITLQVQCDPNQFLYLALPSGFGPTSESVLRNKWETVFMAQEQSARVAFLQPGSMMTLSGTRTLTLFTEGVQRIQWRIERIRDPFLALSAQPYRAHRQVSYRNGVVEATQGELPIGPDQKFTSLSLDQAQLPGGRSGLFQIHIIGQKQVNGHWKNITRAQKRVLVTDTALIAKTLADDRHVIFVSNLMTGQPSQGLTAQLLGANGVPLETVTTDAQGMATFSTTKGLQREKAPTAILVSNKQTGDLAWLSLADSSAIDYVNANHAAGRQLSEDGLTGFIFSERGIYRPGETLHTATIVKKANWEDLPQGLPVSIRMTDSTGTIVANAPLSLSKEGLAQFDWTIPQQQTPGTVKVDLLVGSSILSSQDVYIGDFAPETMRIHAQLENRAKGWRLPSDFTIQAALQMNFGQAATDKAIQTHLQLSSPANLDFPGFTGWTFVDPTPYAGTVDNIKIPVNHTNSQGTAQIALPLSHLPATLQAHVLLEGFEGAGTRAATEDLSFIISPAERMLAWKTQDSKPDFRWNDKDETRKIDFLIVNRFLEPQKQKGLHVHLVLQQSVTELTTDSRGQYRYGERTIEKEIQTTTITTDRNGLAHFSLPTEMPGDFALLVKTADGKTLARIPYHVTGLDLRPALQGELPVAQSKLRIKESDYTTGQTAHLELVSPFDGMALITLEADQILLSRWVSVKMGANAIRIPIHTDYSGRAWFNTSLIRSSNDSARFLKAYARATRPVTLNRKAHTLDIQIDAPQEVQSGRSIPVTVQTSEPSRVFLWAVDRGILSLTKYATPSPVRALLEDRALQVTTRQTLDGLMPEGIQFPNESPFGGGFEATKALGTGLANPFRRTADKAAVWWAGSIQTGPRGHTVMMNLPEEFNGRVRIIATGASEQKVGNGSQFTKIQAPLILTPILPAVVAPQDSFQANILTYGQRPWNGTLKLTLPDGLKSTTNTFALSVDQTGQTQTIIPIQVGDVAGAKKITVLATPENTTMPSYERNPSISIRPATLRSHEISWQSLGDSLLAQQKITTPLFSQDNQTSASISYSPLPLAHSLMYSLQKEYCFSIENRIHMTLPWVLLLDAPVENLPTQDQATFEKEAQTRIQDAVDAIDESLSWMGLARWPWDQPDLLTTTRALDFLLTLRDKGYDVRPLSIQKLTQSIRRQLDETTPKTLEQARTIAWALAQLTREGTLEVERIESLRQRMDQRSIDWKKDVTALYLAYAYRLMRLDNEAKTLENQDLSVSLEQLPYHQIDQLNGLCGIAAAKRLHTEQIQTDELLNVLKTRNIPSLSVREKAFFIGALLQASEAVPEGKTLDNVQLVCSAPQSAQAHASYKKGKNTLRLDAPGCQEFTVQSTKPLSGLYLQTQAQGWPRVTPTEALSQGISVKKRILNADGIETNEVQAGEIITVEIRATRTATDSEAPVIITDLFPGGFAPNTVKESLQGGTVRQSALTEDRIVGICDLTAQESVLTYQLRAQTPGQFTIPAVYAQDSRNPLTKAHDVAQTIKVKDR